MRNDPFSHLPPNQRLRPRILKECGLRPSATPEQIAYAVTRMLADRIAGENFRRRLAQWVTLNLATPAPELLDAVRAALATIPQDKEIPS
jgi:hypothetical protein